MAVQLTLVQPWRTDYAHHITTRPQMFTPSYGPAPKYFFGAIHIEKCTAPMSTYWKVISLDPGGFRSSFSAEEILQNSNTVLISALLNYVRPSCFFARFIEAPQVLLMR